MCRLLRMFLLWCAGRVLIVNRQEVNRSVLLSAEAHRQPGVAGIVGRNGKIRNRGECCRD